MKIIFANRPLFMNPTGWLTGTLVPSGSNASDTDLILPDGTVFSMQPGGGYGSRPARTDGPWEQSLDVNEDKLIFNVNNEFYVVPMIKIG